MNVIFFIILLHHRTKFHYFQISQPYKIADNIFLLL
jgi:hypothetical protein